MSRPLLPSERLVLERLLEFCDDEHRQAAQQLPYLVVSGEFFEPSLALEFKCRSGAVPIFSPARMRGPISSGYARLPDRGIAELILYVGEDGFMSDLEVCHSDEPILSLPAAATIVADYLA